MFGLEGFVCLGLGVLILFLRGWIGVIIIFNNNNNNPFVYFLVLTLFQPMLSTVSSHILTSFFTHTNCLFYTGLEILYKISMTMEISNAD